MVFSVGRNTSVSLDSRPSLSPEHTEQDVELKIIDKLKAKIEEGCEMYPVANAIHPDERHADVMLRHGARLGHRLKALLDKSIEEDIDLLITSKRFKNKLKGLDSNVNRPRSERIPYMKRGGYDRRRR